ncbi:MAG: error-prone DNA polymerase [Rhodospirillaceae bacterium]|nr:error-prone DNA polymerase [Rhodospirillaceae bacterium]
MPPYAELAVTTNFSFLEGGSHPEEIVRTAAALGHRAVAVTDRNTLAGVVRGHLAAKETGIRFVVGARLDFTDAPSLLCFPTDRAAYGRLSGLITLGRLRGGKGECLLDEGDFFDHAEGQIVLALPPEDPDAAYGERLRRLARHLPGRAYLAASHRYRGDDARRIAALADLADSAGTPLVATNDVHYHVPERRPLQDVLTCIRTHCTIDAAGWRLAANAERHVKTPDEMARLFVGHEDAVARSAAIAERCAFSLDSLRYEYPGEVVPEGLTPQAHLVALTEAGARMRYPDGVPAKVRGLLDHEYALIEELDYAPYFLTVHDIVRFAESKGILCQGRGSAANSAVCYCLRITAVDPSRIDLLFERFISSERNEPPDIDVDFEHERREEVIQYIYGKYGRDRAGLSATVISYRTRSAIRDIGKALGLSEDMVGALAGSVWGWSSRGIDAVRVREAGLDPGDRRLALALDLSRQLIGFPRHLSQHVGGFVISRGSLSEMVPIENAAMADRTVIEWDKDDIDALGILKMDVLGLGMLTCIRKAFALLEAHHGRKLTLATVPPDDPAVYDMLCEADSIGVFQVESRAQMTMLPRLRPRTFYDLVIEVAIVRPGPIQGDMVHPYLRRRHGQEPVAFPSKELEDVLGKTKGVPLFQEQAMRIAVVAAGFTPSEADRLRRAMATFRRNGEIHHFRDKLIEGMVARGYERAFAERCYGQIEGFGDYGFPESHAASFALLVYVSAWIKCHYPDVFACAILNSQPMGFYAPAQLVRDARDHGVTVRPVDVNHSRWDCTLEPDRAGRCALRLGFRQVKGLRAADMEALVEKRGTGYRDPRHLWRRSGRDAAALETLARADAFGSMGLKRREALWAVKGLGAPPLPLFAAADRSEASIEATAFPTAPHPSPPMGRRGASDDGAVCSPSPPHWGGEGRGEVGNATAEPEPEVTLPPMTEGEEVIEDYSSLRLTLKTHPLALLRDGLAAERVVRAADLATLPVDRRVTVAGLVLVRQRPGTASGVIFMTLEDETGVANVIVWPKTFERFRKQVLRGRLIRVTGKLQREGIVIHVVSDVITDLSDRLGLLSGPGPTLAPAHSRADHVRHPGSDNRGMPRSRDFH